MKQVKVKQCKYYGCPDIALQGEFCWTHRKYEQAVQRDYCKRSLSDMPTEHELLKKLLTIIEQRNTGEDK
jgi:hypothetical protein